MHNLKQYLIDFYNDEEGLTTVEYAIAGSLVGLAVVAAFGDLGNAVGNAVNNMKNAIES